MTAQELADELDIAPRSVNRILEKYESVFGPLPREDGKRIIPPSDLERIKKAVEAVYKKKAPSYELAFRAQLGQVETVPASKMDMALELLSGVKKELASVPTRLEHQQVYETVQAILARLDLIEKRERKIEALLEPVAQLWGGGSDSEPKSEEAKADAPEEEVAPRKRRRPKWLD